MLSMTTATVPAIPTDTKEELQTVRDNHSFQETVLGVAIRCNAFNYFFNVIISNSEYWRLQPLLSTSSYKTFFNNLSPQQQSYLNAQAAEQEWYNTGKTNKELLQKALGLYVEAASIPSAWRQMGTLYIHLRNYDKAALCYAQALERSDKQVLPKIVSLAYHLATTKRDNLIKDMRSQHKPPIPTVAPPSSTPLINIAEDKSADKFDKFKRLVMSEGTEMLLTELCRQITPKDRIYLADLTAEQRDYLETLHDGPEQISENGIKKYDAYKFAGYHERTLLGGKKINNQPLQPSDSNTSTANVIPLPEASTYSL